MGDPQNGWFIIENPSKISFGGIPNSRNVLFLQIFLKHAAKPSAGSFRELNGRKSCWTWPGSAPKPPRSSPEPSREPCWTFSSTLLNLTWLCTKASQTFSGTFSGTWLNLTRRLHQCTPELFWAEDPISLRCWGKIDDWGYIEAPLKTPFLDLAGVECSEAKNVLTWLRSSSWHSICLLHSKGQVLLCKPLVLPFFACIDWTRNRTRHWIPWSWMIFIGWFYWMIYHMIFIRDIEWLHDITIDCQTILDHTGPRMIKVFHQFHPDFVRSWGQHRQSQLCCLSIQEARDANTHDLHGFVQWRFHGYPKWSTVIYGDKPQ